MTRLPVLAMAAFSLFASPILLLTTTTPVAAQEDDWSTDGSDLSDGSLRDLLRDWIQERGDRRDMLMDLIQERRDQRDSSGFLSAGIVAANWRISCGIIRACASAFAKGWPRDRMTRTAAA